MWLHGKIKTPPFSASGRLEAGFLLRRLQQGEVLSLPHSRPMPTVGAQCHELRITDGDHAWRIMYRVQPDAIVILEVFSTKTDATTTARSGDVPEATDGFSGSDSQEKVAS